MLGAGVMLSACAPVQMGAAAIVGNQRISQSTLSRDVTGLQGAIARYPAQQVQMTATRAPKAVLGLLVQFGIWDRVAKDTGVSVTAAQVSDGENRARQQFEQEAAQQLQQMEQQGGSVSQAELQQLAQIMQLNYGVSPQLMPAFGRNVAQQVAVETKLNDGKPVTSQAEYNRVVPKLTAAINTAVKELNIKVNPQYGKLDASQGTIVDSPDVLSKPASPAAAAGAAAS